MKLTPTQIALLALAHATRARGPNEVVCVWGSWQTAALELVNRYFALVPLGTRRGTREMEWQTLHGRHRRGREGRIVHVYQLAYRIPHAVQLAARCAWAVEHKPEDRQHVTWRDVPTEIPRSAWAPHGRRCPACSCVPGKPCTIDLPNGCGAGTCVPAGVFGFDRCTACQIREAA
jgi:hypothetical protein